MKQSFAICHLVESSLALTGSKATIIYIYIYSYTQASMGIQMLWFLCRLIKILQFLWRISETNKHNSLTKHLSHLKGIETNLNHPWCKAQTIWKHRLTVFSSPCSLIFEYLNKSYAQMPLKCRDGLDLRQLCFSCLSFSMMNDFRA